MGNTSTKDAETTSPTSRFKPEASRPAPRPVIHHPVSVTRHSSSSAYNLHSPAVIATSYSSGPTISKASYSSTSSSRSHHTTSSPSYAPSAPSMPKSPKVLYASRVTPIPSQDPFHFGPSSSRRVSSTESRGSPVVVTVSTTRPSNSNSCIRTSGNPVIFWDKDSRCYSTSNAGTSSFTSNVTTTSTTRVSETATSRANSTISSLVDGLSSDLNNISVSSSTATSSVPVTPAVRNVSANISSHRGSSNSSGGSGLLPTPPLPPQSYNNHASSTSRHGLNGAPRNFPKPQSTPSVRVYTPLNNTTPLQSLSEAVQNNNFNGQRPNSNDSNRGNRGRPFPRGRGKYRGNFNNSNNAGETNGNQGNNQGGRNRGRGNYRGNYRGGFNNNNNPNQQMTSSERDNGRGDDSQQDRSETQNNPFDAIASENSTETGEGNPRGRGRVFTRGRGRGNNNARRGQGRRNRGGGPNQNENYRREENNSGVTVSQSNSTTPALDLENSKYECPICMEALRPPIFQCHNGHMVCNGCEGQIRQCPICREEMPTKKIRNLPIEQIIRGEN